MGQRYACILRALGLKFAEKELMQGWPISKIEKIIIATPTDTHSELIRRASQLYPQADILCEKPIATSLEELESVRPYSGRLYCVNQYQYLPMDSCGSFGDDASYYDYFRHGQDGLAWDCFQIIALATGRVLLLENSPIWQCKINGHIYSIRDMDRAYVDMLRDFLGPMERVWGWEKIENTTRKVVQWISENSSSRASS